MDVLDAIHGRRSIRAYRAESVKRTLIEDLIWAAVQAPTPPISGDTPWAFCVIEGIGRLADYGERARQYVLDHQPEGRRQTWTDRPGFKVFWDAPALILICSRRGNHEAAFDCCRAGQNLMLAAHARGLGSCWVGAPIQWLTSPGVATELGVPADFDPTVALVLGYPAEAPAGNPRGKPVIHWCGAGTLRSEPTPGHPDN